MVVAFNMTDIARRKGIVIDAARLAHELGVRSSRRSAIKASGARDLIKVLDSAVLPPERSGRIEWRSPTARDIEHDQSEVRRILGVVGGDRIDGGDRSATGWTRWCCIRLRDP